MVPLRNRRGIGIFAYIPKETTWKWILPNFNNRSNKLFIGLMMEILLGLKWGLFNTSLYDNVVGSYNS